MSESRYNPSSVLPPAIFLMGPTASGKTDLAIALCERLPCEIISVDSAMVYRGMDIGTAKPDSETLERAPHRLIDILDPAEAYSAARFRQDALCEMAEITAHGRVPLLVGGTMLYYRALQHGLSELPAADAGIRARLEAEAETLGWPAMHARLAEIDPEAAQRIHPNDPQRLQRALEIHAITGRSMSELWREQQGVALPYQLVKLVIAPPERHVLHERIALRFRLMMEQGFLDEVEVLHRRPDLSADNPSVRCVGYRQAWDYLDGNIDYDGMVERAIIATRQLAKRQFTWLRSEQGADWLDSTSDGLVEKGLKLLGRVMI